MGFIAKIIEYIISRITSVTFFDILDIAIVSVVFYYIFKFVQDRRAGKLAIGILLIILLMLVSDIFNMYALNFLLSNVVQVGIIGILIVFQSELRFFLEKVGGNSFIAKSGSVVVIDNFVVHSYGEGETKEYYALILPYDKVEEFNRLRRDMVLKQIHVEDSDFALSIAQIIREHLNENATEYQRDCAVNLIMALILKKCGLTQGERGSENGLIHKILSFSQENFKENISLKSVAKELGYAEGYLSRVFHHYFKESYPRYVNGLRLNYIERELQKKEKNVTELIFEAGFNSFQTYYRSKQLIGNNADL